MSVAGSIPSDNTARPARAPRKGDRFRLAGLTYCIAYVNPSRAHSVATVRVPVAYRTRAGEARAFHATRRIAIDISPTTDLQLVSELCGGGR